MNWKTLQPCGFSIRTTKTRTSACSPPAANETRRSMNSSCWAWKRKAGKSEESPVRSRIRKKSTLTITVPIRIPTGKSIFFPALQLLIRARTARISMLSQKRTSIGFSLTTRIKTRSSTPIGKSCKSGIHFPSLTALYGAAIKKSQPHFICDWDFWFLRACTKQIFMRHSLPACRGRPHHLPWQLCASISLPYSSMPSGLAWFSSKYSSSSSSSCVCIVE